MYEPRPGASIVKLPFSSLSTPFIYVLSALSICTVASITPSLVSRSTSVPVIFTPWAMATTAAITQKQAASNVRFN